jgi:hypothetical protein
MDERGIDERGDDTLPIPIDELGALVKRVERLKDDLVKLREAVNGVNERLNLHTGDFHTVF